MARVRRPYSTKLFRSFPSKKKSYRLQIVRLSYLTCIRMKASSEDGMKAQRAPQRKSTPIYAREGHGPVKSYEPVPLVPYMIWRLKAGKRI